MENKLLGIVSHVGSEKPRGLMKYAELTNDGEWRRLLFVQGGVVKPVRENLPDGGVRCQGPKAGVS